MRIYLASRYSRRLELCSYRKEIEILGHAVTSRWLNGDHQISEDGKPIGDDGEQLIEAGRCERATELRQAFALEDLKDVITAELLIAFTEPPRSDASRGGRHVEFGIALGRMQRVWAVGYRENIFHWIPDVQFFPTWEECFARLASESHRKPALQR